MNEFINVVHAIGGWVIYRQDAGMSESDYCVLLNDIFFCRVNELDIAKQICAWGVQHDYHR